MTKNVLADLKKLSISLQKSSKDICKAAYSEISTVMEALIEVREKIDDHHSLW